MSDVAIVLGSNIHWAPYYYKYEKLLKEQGKKFDLIIWNREGINEDNGACKVISFNVKDVSNNKNPFKVFKFILFTRFVCRTLKKERYKKVIFLGTHGCAPIFGAYFLKTKYFKRYWLDIRDYQYEWFTPFFYLEKLAIKNSYNTAISSVGYKRFLPTYNYINVHNVDPNMDNVIKQYKKKDDNRIRISFIGNVRYLEECIKVVNVFKNDTRFLLQFFGSGSEKIEKYCHENNIKNTRFHGRFKLCETVHFYNITDIVNNVYGNDSIGLTTALSNKLYYCLSLKIPILVSEGTYTEEFSKKYGFGFVFRNEKNYPDQLYYEYTSKLQKPEYGEAWKTVLQEEHIFYEEFIKFVG